MKRYRLDPKKPRQLTPEEQARLHKARIDYSDIPPLGDEFFSKAKQAWPPAKQQLTIRLDADILDVCERMAGAIRPASTAFCGRQWKARAAKISAPAPRAAAHPRHAAGRAVHNAMIFF